MTPNQANAVAFGADGSVYVTGSAQTTTAAQGPQGPSNSFLQVFSTTGVRVANTQIATGGPNTSNGIAVDGTNVYVAGVQNGDAVVNEYDLSNPKAPALVASRDLGSLGGGTVAGVVVQNGTVYVGGSTRNTSLNAGAVTSAAPGSGLTAFAATFSTGLAPASSDAIAYYGGASGDTKATGMTVADGDVYLTGSATGDLPGEPAIGAKDGFVAALNVGAGTVDYAQRFTGLDGQVAPTSIAVAPTGASVLDQLGLPQGVVDGPVLESGDSHHRRRGRRQLQDRRQRRSAGDHHRAGHRHHGLARHRDLQGDRLYDQRDYFAGPGGRDGAGIQGFLSGLDRDAQQRTGGQRRAVRAWPEAGRYRRHRHQEQRDRAAGQQQADLQPRPAGLARSVVVGGYQDRAGAARRRGQRRRAGLPVSQERGDAGQRAGPAEGADQRARRRAYLSSEIANYQSALTRLTAGSSSSSSSSSSGLASLFTA
ncbi:MAG: hypothetical protein WDM85_14700 [Caulobacteraceae bacterium]